MNWAKSVTASSNECVLERVHVSSVDAGLPVKWLAIYLVSNFNALKSHLLLHIIEPEANFSSCIRTVLQ